MKAIEHVHNALHAAGSWTRDGKSWACPAHDDRTPSLSVGEGDDGRPLLHCHAGCTFEEIVEAVGPDLRDLCAASRTSERLRGNSEAGAAQAKPTPPEVESLGEPTDAQVAALVRSKRLRDGETLRRLGAKHVRVWGKAWLGFPTLAGGWKLWGPEAEGNASPEDGKLKRRSVGCGSLVVSPALHERFEGGAKEEIPCLLDVEGESDLIAAVEAGYPYVVTGTGGARCLAGHERHDADLLAFDPGEVAVFGDLDEAGRKGAVKKGAWWGKHGVTVRVPALRAALGEHGDLRDLLNGKIDEPWPEAAADELDALVEAADRLDPQTVVRGEGEYGWPDEPQPLPPALPDTPALRPEILPGPIRDWIVDTSDRMAVPLECIAAPAIVGLGAVVGRSVGVAPKAHDNWVVVPNMWGGLVGPPGVMKSACVEEGVRPVRQIAGEEWEKAEAKHGQLKPIREAYQAQLNNLKRRVVKDPETFAQEYRSIMAEIAKCEVAMPRLTTSDATIEKLADLQAGNRRGLFMIRDELAGWLNSFERDYARGSREFFLEAWNGDGRFEVDRITRGSTVVEGLCLSVCGGIQPGKLAPLVRGSTRGGDQDDGLLQRLQVVVWPSDFGAYRDVDRWPHTEARNRAFTVYRDLYELKPEVLGAAPLREKGIPVLRLSEGALGLFRDWREELENWLRSEAAGFTPPFAAHLAKYRSLVPSLALLFHLAEVVDGQVTDGVSPSSMQHATSWAEFLMQHSFRVYADALGGSAVGARALAERIRAGSVADGMTARDVAQNHWSRLASSDDVEAALDVLEPRGWARRERRETGGRPAVVIRLHPSLRSRS